MTKAWILAAALVACHPERGPRPAEELPATASPVVVDDALPWPYRLDRIALWVDGVLLYRGADPDGRPIAGLELSPGDHTVAARARVSFLAAPGGERCGRDLRASQGVRVSGPTRIALRLGASGIHEPFGARPRLAVQADGAELLPFAPLDEHAVAPPDSSAARLAALRARLQQAEDRGETLAAACYRQHVERVQSNLGQIEQSKALGGELAPVVVAAHERAIEQIYAEAILCLPEEPATEMVAEPSCGADATLPMPWPAAYNEQ